VRLAVATLYPSSAVHGQIDWLNRPRAPGRQGTRRTGERCSTAGQRHRKLGDWNSAKVYLERDLESALATATLSTKAGLQMLAT